MAIIPRPGRPNGPDGRHCGSTTGTSGKTRRDALGAAVTGLAATIAACGETGAGATTNVQGGGAKAPGAAPSRP